ncbi:MAG: hypothetical protein QOJ71_309 [Actinomycetota bacterium]|nr:hypothetical protein [Actinomycetota bacterium]
MKVPTWLARATERLELERRLDPAVSVMTRVAEPLAANGTGEIQRGEWLGHALHPLLTDLPLGCWLGAGLLDVVGGRRARPAAQRLVGLGLLMVPPTAAAGLVDSTTTDDPRARRVATVHGAGNTLVALLYFRSWSSRRKGRYGRGRLFGVAGGLLAWYTGYLGGHLSFGRGVGQGLRGLDLDDDHGAEQLSSDRLRQMATNVAEQS